MKVSQLMIFVGIFTLLIPTAYFALHGNSKVGGGNSKQPNPVLSKALATDQADKISALNTGIQR